MKTGLREGFTTGAASAAAVMASLIALVSKKSPAYVEIKVPAGFLKIPVAKYLISDNYSKSVVIKDGGDDPDNTHNIEIVAEAFFDNWIDDFKTFKELKLSNSFKFYTSEGVGVVTRKGLPVSIGEPAVNPVPRKIIKEIAEKLIAELNLKKKPSIVISVPQGKEIAKKTLNERLGIIGGISILGTTGVVKPVSMDAFKESIKMALNVAYNTDSAQLVLSFGRQSEVAAINLLKGSEESYVLMGDHFHYALSEAKEMGFKKIIIGGQLGKILKALLGFKNTNVKYGEFEIAKVIDYFRSIGVSEKDMELLKDANTARHLLEIIEKGKKDYIVEIVAKKFKETFNTEVLLVSYDGKVLARA